MKKLTLIGIAAVAALLLSLAPSALARGGKDDDRIVKRGACTASSTWKLKAKSDDGRIDTEFKIDQNRVGKRWRVTLVRNGSTAFRGVRTTVAPEWIVRAAPPARGGIPDDAHRRFRQGSAGRRDLPRGGLLLSKRSKGRPGATGLRSRRSQTDCWRLNQSAACVRSVTPICCLDRVDVRHREIHQYDVRLRLGDQLDRLGTICRGIDDLDVCRRCQQAFEPRSHQAVVLGEQDADHVATSTDTRDPVPGLDSTSNSARIPHQVLEHPQAEVPVAGRMRHVETSAVVLDQELRPVD